MWTTISQAGLTGVVVDFTDELSLLFVGLLALLWLSAAMIAVIAIRAHRQSVESTVTAAEGDRPCDSPTLRPQHALPQTMIMPIPTEHRDAA